MIFIVSNIYKATNKEKHSFNSKYIENVTIIQLSSTYINSYFETDVTSNNGVTNKLFHNIMSIYQFKIKR